MTAATGATGSKTGVAGLSVGVLRNPGFDAPVDAEGVAAVERAAALLAEAGATVDEANPDLPDTRAIFAGVWGAALSRLVATLPRTTARLARSRHPRGGAGTGRHERHPVPGRRGDARRRRPRHGSAAPDASTWCCARPCRPARRWPTLRPSNPVEALGPQWAPWTFTFNITRQPAITVPMGLRANGMPHSVQLAAAQYRDDLVLRAARVLEQAEPFPVADLG